MALVGELLQMAIVVGQLLEAAGQQLLVLEQLLEAVGQLLLVLEQLQGLVGGPGSRAPRGSGAQGGTSVPGAVGGGPGTAAGGGAAPGGTGAPGGAAYTPATGGPPDRRPWSANWLGGDVAVVVVENMAATTPMANVSA